ncbi:MAG: transcription antitermination factor NusB [bacterium]|nr:transcription antitermination factor NusB [bacterium]
MASSKSSRRLARRKAFELLFELQQHPGLSATRILERSFDDPDVLEVYCIDEDSDGYVVLPAQVGDDDIPTMLAPQAQPTRTFVCELVNAVVTHEKQIDAELSKYPEDWSYERIGTSERILLQLAVAEMVYLGTSYKVVIDEILDIAKLYAQEDATRFINGILGAVVRNLPALKQSISPEAAKSET